MAVAFYPGSFDPFHLGHLDVVEQAVSLFGELERDLISLRTKEALAAKKASILAVKTRCMASKRS
jgi:cytidyltransferase-like protein